MFFELMLKMGDMLKSKARKTYLLGNWYHTVRISAHMKNDDSHQKSYYNNSATK